MDLFQFSFSCAYIYTDFSFTQDFFLFFFCINLQRNILNNRQHQAELIICCVDKLKFSHFRYVNNPIFVIDVLLTSLNTVERINTCLLRSRKQHFAN